MGALYGNAYIKCGPRLHQLKQQGTANYMIPGGSQIL